MKLPVAAAFCALLGASAAVSLPDDFDVQAAMENPGAFGDDVLAEILRVNDPSLVLGSQGIPGADSDNETDADLLVALEDEDDVEDKYAGQMSEDSELLSFSLCQFGLASTQSQRDGSDTDLMVIKYVTGKSLHEQCQRATGNKLWACGGTSLVSRLPCAPVPPARSLRHVPPSLSSRQALLALVQLPLYVPPPAQNVHAKRPRLAHAAPPALALPPGWYRSHTSYNWYDQRSRLFKTSAARTGMYTSFVKTGHFDNWKHRMPNCDSINVSVCCSSECEGW